MSSTTSETYTRERATIHTGPAETIRPASERTHFARMAGLYAWILVTLAIFIMAAMLSGIQKSQAAAIPGDSRIQVIGAAHHPTL